MSPNELPWDTAAYWGAFLFSGMLEYENSLESDHHLVDHYHSGYLELVSEITALLPMIWEEAINHPRWDHAHPGVFEYEVIGTLGEFIAEELVRNEYLPNEETIRATARYSIRQFFNQA